tara:strand:+ start:1070 stop:1417 length:348 start_codon:yes stop_codon:yes gene_type:complete
MPIHKVYRRTLSKVEQQLLKEKEDEINHIKQQKKAAWIKKQNEIKKYNQPTFTPTRTSKTTKESTKRITIIAYKVPLPILGYNWKCLNNSWADQTEFEDIRKQMLMRMAYKLMKC